MKNTTFSGQRHLTFNFTIVIKLDDEAVLLLLSNQSLSMPNISRWIPTGVISTFTLS